MEFILSREINCPKSGNFTNITDKVRRAKYLQVSIVVFWGAVEKFFGQRWLTPHPQKKLVRTPMQSIDLIFNVA